MLHAWQRFWRRRRLRPIAAKLPWALQTYYGGKRTYTYGQVKAAHEKLQLSGDLLPVSAAAYCVFEEFARGGSAATAEAYEALRDEFATLFDVHLRDLNAEGIRKRRIAPAWNTSEHEYDPFGGAGST